MAAGRAQSEDGKDDKEKKPPVKAKEKSEEPPPRIESAHQVLLRLHLHSL